MATEFFDEEIGTEEFVTEIDDPGAGEGVLTASTPTPGGTVSAFLRLEGPTSNRVREVLVTGDFFVTPPRTMYDLEASLRGVEVGELRSAIDRFSKRRRSSC